MFHSDACLDHYNLGFVWMWVESTGFIALYALLKAAEAKSCNRGGERSLGAKRITGVLLVVLVGLDIASKVFGLLSTPGAITLIVISLL